MRILNLYFKNINSLEGESRIHFDKGPIADSGVFAITGPNGSGKSSILDAMTLALYGETYRLNKPATHVVTKHAQECAAQVEFAVENSRYRSAWRIDLVNHLNEQIDLAQPSMQLWEITGQEVLLAETPNQVRKLIAELTGMDFHKFSKSIVLPQGDFAAFLRALDSERMDILEKISGSSIYSDQIKQLEAKHAQISQTLTQLRQDLAALPLMSQAEVDAAIHDLEDNQDEVADLKQKQQRYQSNLAQALQIAELEQTQQKLHIQQQTLTTDLHLRESQLAQIDQHAAALHYRSDIELLDQKQTQIRTYQTELEQIRHELTLLQAKLAASNATAAPPLSEKSLAEQQQAIDSLKLSVSELKLELPRQQELAESIRQAIHNSQNAQSELDLWLDKHSSDAVLVEQFPDVVRLRNLRNELVELGKKQKNQTNWSKNTGASLQKTKDSLQKLQAELKDSTAKIEADRQTLAELAQGRPIDSLLDLQQEQQNRVNDFLELISLANATAKLTHKGLLSWLGIKKPAETPLDANLLVSRVDELHIEIAREENIIKVLERALRNEALVKKMSAERAKLIEGQPCFLCGSTTHPYAQKPPVFTDAKQALHDQRNKIQALKSRLEQANAQLISTEKQNFRLSAKQKRLQQMQSQWTLLANRLNIMRAEMHIENLSLQKYLLAHEMEELDKINGTVKQHQSLQRSIAKMQADVAAKQEQQQKLVLSVTELEAAWANRPADYDEVEKRFTECRLEEQALSTALKQQLATLGEKLPGRGKENSLFDRLNARRQDYQVYQLRKQGVLKEVAGLQEQLRAGENRITLCQQQLQQYSENLNSQEQLGIHIAIIEKQKLLIAREHELRIVQIEHNTILETVAHRLAGTSIKDITMLRELLALIARQAEIQAAHDNLKAQLDENAERRVGLQTELAEAYAQASDLPAPQELQHELQQIANRIELFEHEIVRLEQKLEKQNTYRDQFESLSRQLEQQSKLYEQTGSELQAIQDDPAGFKQRIRQILADRLLAETNRILERLSGRYFVRSGVSEHGLALEIEDSKQQNVRRLPQTLSGGESFVVSLALALALAEIAGNGKSIDSFFLDEGFGNLDAESLYLVMSTLENLKTHGKVIGVISHIDGVKKRIKTQIELVKKPNGLSELKMVA
ncbi:AAA family ATPase [Methylomonas rhizoryzae]|uniref:AAA family ATPase n=1 Tax=Methylomonas rhizoryzae TaxID=2608981 RepID=UPI0012323532|nr:AAA family ATPase [Methylomonas rhizoryzae]